jgi:hypothetical protein
MFTLVLLACLLTLAKMIAVMPPSLLTMAVLMTPRVEQLSTSVNTSSSKSRFIILFSERIYFIMFMLQASLRLSHIIKQASIFIFIFFFLKEFIYFIMFMLRASFRLPQN